MAVDRLAPLLVGEGAACEPVVPVTGLAWLAVRAVVTLLAINPSAGEESLLKAVLSRLLFGVSREVVGVEELVNQLLVLADTVTEHAAVIAVVINAPLHVDHLALLEGLHDIAPVGSRAVVVSRGAGAVATRAAAANWSGGNVGPRGHWLQDRTLSEKRRRKEVEGFVCLCHGESQLGTKKKKRQRNETMIEKRI